jgi:hypothetical protein
VCLVKKFEKNPLSIVIFIASALYFNFGHKENALSIRQFESFPFFSSFAKTMLQAGKELGMREKEAENIRFILSTLSPFCHFKGLARFNREIS